MEIIGVYIPSDCPATQQAIHAHIAASEARCASEGTTLLWGGDLNATLHDEDRSSNLQTPADRQYR